MGEFFINEDWSMRSLSGIELFLLHVVLLWLVFLHTGY